MLQQNKPKKDRSVTSSSTIQTEQTLVATKDNPLYNLSPDHPDYRKIVLDESSILDSIGNTPIATSFESISSIVINPYNPAVTTTSAPTFTSFLSTPANVSVLVQAGTYTQETGADGSIRDTITITFDDVVGASSYEVAVKEV